MSATPVEKRFGNYATLAEALASLRADTKIDEDTRKQLEGELYQAEYGPKFNMEEFAGLLGKLEGSKMKQQRQKSVEGRRDIYAGGLAGMMSNF